MGIIDLISGAIDWVKEKVEYALDWISDKLGGSSYDNNSIDDQVDVDKVLSEFRDSMKEKVAGLEKQCMGEIGELFTGLKRMTRERFPDLVEIIERKQTDAEDALNGTIMQYVKEHLSKNDSDFLRVLEMPPGPAKKSALNKQSARILGEAESNFNKRLTEQVKTLQQEFENRLKSRLDEQENQMKERIARLEMMEKQAEEGSVDIAIIENRSIPIMEASECIRVLFEMGN